MTRSLLALGSNYPSLRNAALGAFDQYLHNCAEAVEAVTPFASQDSATPDNGVAHDSANVLSIAVSLVGFLDAASTYVTFWSAGEKLPMVEHLREMLSESFMVAIETASSRIRHLNAVDSVLKDWKRYTRRYAAAGRPLGAMVVQKGYMGFIKSCAASLTGSPNLANDEFLNDYMNGVGFARSPGDAEISLTQCLTEIITDEIRLLADGSDYLQIGSPWQQQLTHSVKGFAFVGFLNCIILSEDAANAESFILWLDGTLLDPTQMSSRELAASTLKSVAITARTFPDTAPDASQSLMRFIVHGGASPGPTVALAAMCLAQVLGILSQDAVLTTLYSLGNVLSAGSSTERPYQHQLLGDGGDPNSTGPDVRPRSESVASLSVNAEEDTTTYRNVIHAVVTIAASCNDNKISALAQSMLLQKIGKVNDGVDAYIIRETASLALTSGPAELQLLLRFYSRIYRGGVSKGNTGACDAIQSALVYLSVTLRRDSPLYRLYLMYLLESIVNNGDTTDLKKDRQHNVTLGADDFSPLLKPLALLVANDATASSSATADYDEVVSSMFRDAWFNLAVHGFFLSSFAVKRHATELCLLAKHSPSLVAEDRTELLESDMELNTILRRGMSSHRVAEQKKMLIAELPSRESEVKRLSYPKAVFLNAALLVESLRATSGNCTRFLSYFLDPALAAVEMASCMNAIAEKVVTSYLSKTVFGRDDSFSAPFLAKQLADLFVACCHRIERVQNVAVLCANKIIQGCPSALCQEHSLFALLEVLTVMWSACLDGELDEFEWKSSFTSPRGLVTVDLPDNYNFRRSTFDLFLERARAWVTAVMNIAPLDVKGILQVGYLHTV